MQLELDIDLPADVLERYEPVAFRIGKGGEIYLRNGVVCQLDLDDESVRPVLILRPRATWDEWPVWLTKPEAVARDNDQSWYAYLKAPNCGPCGWMGSPFMRLDRIVQYTNLTLPTYDGPWEHSLIRNPHLGKVQPVAVDTDGGRRDLFKVWHDSVFFSEYHDRKDAERCVSAHPDASNCEIERLRTVLPGDPDPDAAKRLIEAAQSVMDDYRIAATTDLDQAVVSKRIIDELSQSLAAAKGGQ